MQNHVGRLSMAMRTWTNVFVVLLACAICQGSVSAQAPRLRLGTPQVLSSLGSPLQVRVPIDVSAIDEPVSSSRFSLGARPPNAAVPFIERADLTVESVGDSVVLVIRTRAAIEEPAIGIVIREQLPNGVRSREYFLLLDPPSLIVVSQPDGRADLAIATSSPAIIAAAVQPTDVKTVATPNVDAKKTLHARKPTPSASAAVASSISVGATRPTPEQLSLKAPAYTEGGPRLRLSGGGDLTSIPVMTEAEREILRARQLTLEMDDLTSVLLDREHRILQLEKELAGLATRISIAERVISSAAIPADAQKAASQVAAPDTSATMSSLATNVVKADDKLATRAPSSLSWITWLSVLAVLALAAILGWRLRSKYGASAESIQAGDNGEVGLAAAVLSPEVARNAVSPATIAAKFMISVLQWRPDFG